ncbi:hypothetical protein [Burkholderia pseudomultivorans]|uniref:hypothetical protein n=1 Tax=Burkholderia pseudomultivorans TaxID=1207504 RepID=UPI0012D93747|nr:hypothetical protein [Burkholderia pseudomultivorans]
MPASAEIVDFEAVKRINQENDQDRAEYRNLADDARPFLIGSHKGSPVYDGVKVYRRPSGTWIMLRDIGMPEILPVDRSRLYQIGGRDDNRKIRPAIFISVLLCESGRSTKVSVTTGRHYRTDENLSIV